jgi:hypothetical protein
MRSLVKREQELTQARPFASNELVEAYLRQSREQGWSGLGLRHPRDLENRAGELWDYLGDYA